MFLNSLFPLPRAWCLLFTFGKRTCRVNNVVQAQACANLCVATPTAEMFQFCFAFTMLHDLVRTEAADLTGFFQTVYRRGCKIKLSFNLFSSGTLWGCSESEIPVPCFKTKERDPIQRKALLPAEPQGEGCVLEGVPWRSLAGTPVFHCGGPGFSPWCGN